MDFAPEMASGLTITATQCGYYDVTPDQTPIISRDANQENLVHAAGCSGHGLMHAPFTAALIEGLITDDVSNNHLHLPAPFGHHTINLAPFAADRSFADQEALVL